MYKNFAVLNPLTFTVSPAKDYFNISVDEYDKTAEFSVGTIDFKSVSPSNFVFEFLRYWLFCRQRIAIC